jgi:hypothetical protein
MEQKRAWLSEHADTAETDEFVTQKEALVNA